MLWDFDTEKEFKTVNGITAHGGSLDGAGPIIVDGIVYVNSGYRVSGHDRKCFARVRRPAIRKVNEHGAQVASKRATPWIVTTYASIASNEKSEVEMPGSQIQ